MKNIDFTDLGYGILIACLGGSMIIDSLGDIDRRKVCDRRGGVLTKDGWFGDKYCHVQPAPQKVSPTTN